VIPIIGGILRAPLLDGVAEQNPEAGLMCIISISLPGIPGEYIT
jgi:hypothetical protein